MLAPFYLVGGHTELCPHSEIITELDDCKTAATYLLADSESCSSMFSGTESSESYPNGCYKYYNATMDPNGCSVYWNTNSNGSLNENARSICKGNGKKELRTNNVE